MRAVWLNVCAYFEIFPLFAVITIRVVTQKKKKKNKTMNYTLLITFLKSNTVHYLITDQRK